MVRPRSMSIPPEASAPVLMVSKPMRIGSDCARTMPGKPSADAPAAAPAAWMNFLRLIAMVPSSSKLGGTTLRQSGVGSNHGKALVRGEAGRLRNAELPANQICAAHDGHELVVGVAPAHPFAPHAAVRSEDEAL